MCIVSYILTICLLLQVHSDLETEQQLNLNLRQSKLELVSQLDEHKKDSVEKDKVCLYNTLHDVLTTNLITFIALCCATDFKR